MSCNATTYSTAVDECYRGGARRSATETKVTQSCPLTAQAFLECVSLHCDGPCVFDIEALPSISKLHLRYRGVQIVFDIEVCRFDIDVEIRPSISKLYLRYRRLEICFDIVKMYSISKIFDIGYDISIKKSSISTLQDFRVDIGCFRVDIIGHNMQ